jgi:hypothetical protein
MLLNSCNYGVDRVVSIANDVTTVLMYPPTFDRPSGFGTFCMQFSGS